MSPRAARHPSRRKKVGQAYIIYRLYETYRKRFGGNLRALCPDSVLFFLRLALVLSAEEVVNLASRRLSVSPSCASSNSHRNYSFRRGSVWSVRSLASAEGIKIHDDDDFL